MLDNFPAHNFLEKKDMESENARNTLFDAILQNLIENENEGG